MNLRPFTPKLITHCVTTPYCRDCIYRVGCEFRYLFYQRTEMELEVQLQLAEIKSNATLNPTKSAETANDIFNATEHLRKKIRNEKMMHPHFSFM